MAKEYRILVSSTRGGIISLAANGGWTLYGDSKSFTELSSNDDDSLGDIGRILVKKTGYVALAYRE